MKKIIIAIDGPAGSGKSTTAKLLSQKLNYVHIDTGAMYRAVGLAWIRSGNEMNDENLFSIVKDMKITQEQSVNGVRTIMNGEDVSGLIRTPEISKAASDVSAFNSVRERLVAMQQDMGKIGGVILDGRDIGTVVFPNAELKVFLVASIETRAKRRAKELEEKGVKVNLDDLTKEIEERDRNDSTRAISPLMKATDAKEIDTSKMTIEEQVEIIYSMVNELK